LWGDFVISTEASDGLSAQPNIPKWVKNTVGLLQASAGLANVRLILTGVTVHGYTKQAVVSQEQCKTDIRLLYTTHWKCHNFLDYRCYRWTRECNY